MDFQLSDDQRALQEGIRSLINGAISLEAIRTKEGADDTVEQAWWDALNDAGVFSLLVAEQDGGVGLSLADGVVVAEELARGLVPGPLLSTMVLGPGLADAAGGMPIALIDQQSPNSAVPLLLEHPQTVKSIVVLPHMGDAAGQCRRLDPSTLTLSLVDEPLDPLTPLAVVQGTLPEGEAIDGLDAVGLRQRSLVLLGAAQVGIAEVTVELAVEYAKGREQFGRPIGSFQAVKHLLADALCRTELARSACWAAAVTLDNNDVATREADTLSCSPGEVRWRVAAGAKMLADDAALANARTAIQVYGGMGFTWEVPIHLYLKRARVLAQTLATRTQLADLLSALI